MDKKRYYEIILEEDKKLQGPGGAVFVDVQYYAAVRFAEEYHKAEIAKAEYAKWEKSTEYKIHDYAKHPLEWSYVATLNATQEALKGLVKTKMHVPRLGITLSDTWVKWEDVQKIIEAGPCTHPPEEQEEAQSTFEKKLAEATEKQKARRYERDR